jgi:hypothetical protein
MQHHTHPQRTENMKFSVVSLLLLTPIGGIFLPGYQPLLKAEPLGVGVHLITQNAPKKPVGKVETTLNTQFQLKYGQNAQIRTERLEVNFIEVTEDSRCPSDVACIWQGQVTVGLNLTKNGKNFGKLNLTLSPDGNNLAMQSFDRYTVKLMQVLPYPKSDQKTRIADYSVTLVVSRK